jgi:hypothetical protein
MSNSRQMAVPLFQVACMHDGEHGHPERLSNEILRDKSPTQEVEMKRIYQLFAVVIAMLLFSGLLFPQSKYIYFTNLNQGSVDVTSSWTKLNTAKTTHTFTKSSSSTTIEVYINSRFSVGALASDTSGIQFQVRVDDGFTNIGNEASILKSNTSESLSILGVFQNLPAGSHTVSIWAKAAGSSAKAVIVDPGYWGGEIIVKETM